MTYVAVMEQTAPSLTLPYAGGALLWNIRNFQDVDCLISPFRTSFVYSIFSMGFWKLLFIGTPTHTYAKHHRQSTVDTVNAVITRQFYMLLQKDMAPNIIGMSGIFLCVLLLFALIHSYFFLQDEYMRRIAWQYENICPRCKGNNSVRFYFFFLFFSCTDIFMALTYIFIIYEYTSIYQHIYNIYISMCIRCGCVSVAMATIYLTSWYPPCFATPQRRNRQLNVFIEGSYGWCQIFFSFLRQISNERSIISWKSFVLKMLEYV